MMKKGAEIYIYRNLTRGGFSLRYKGRVIDHSDGMFVVRPKFTVSLAGNSRVRREKKKYVHAYISGENGDVTWPYQCGVPTKDWVKVVYNPYTMTTFQVEATGKRVWTAAAAVLLPRGVYVLWPNYD
jgi:hypothetical protein